MQSLKCSAHQNNRSALLKKKIMEIKKLIKPRNISTTKHKLTNPVALFFSTNLTNSQTKFRSESE